MTRRAESGKVRSWNGIVASSDELDERRVWVVWGVAAPPEHAAVVEEYPEGTPADEVGIAIASEADPAFAAADDDHRWIMLVEGDEDDIDAWVSDHPIASAYAPYLIPARPPR